MAVRTFSIKFLGEVKDFQQKAKYAKSSLEDVQRAATSPGLTNSMARMSAMGDNLKRAGEKVSDFGGTLTRKITAPALGAAGAVAGITAALGFKRLVGIDTARAQFQGLGYDADAVMEQVTEGVNNTALAMADGASIAAGILATGAVPMDKLEDSIKRVANVSAAYNVESEQAAYLLNNVLTKNKVTYGDLSQMQKNGIPIISQLADHYGVAGDEIMKMAQDGKISIEDLNKVIDDNAGKAAEEYGKSWAGVTANIKSNLGKIGAKALGEGFEIVKDKAAGLLEVLRSDDLSDWAETAGAAIGTFLGDTIEKIEKLIGWWQDLSPEVKKFAGMAAGAAVAAGPFLIVLGKVATIAGVLMTVIPKLVAVIAAIASPVGLVVAGVALLVAGLVWFFTKTETGQKIVTAAWDGIKAAMSAVTDWWTGTAQPALSAAWDKVQESAAQVAAWYQQHVAPVFQAFGELVRAVMDNWVRPALDRMGRDWDRLWQLIKVVWDKAGPPLIAYVKGAFEGMKIVLERIWNAVKIHIETVLGVIKGIIQVVTSVIKGDWSGAWTAIKNINKTIIDGIRRQIENVIGGVRDWLASVWTTIKNVARASWEGVRDSVMGVVDPLKDRMVGAFEAAQRGIGTALDKIKGAAAKPVNFFINTVWNDGLRKALNLIPGVSMGKATPIRGYQDGGRVNLPWSASNRDPYVGQTANGGLFRFEGEEFFTKRSSTARMTQKHPGVLEYINEHGDLPGYAKGGRVHPVSSGIGTSYPGHTGRDFGRAYSSGYGTTVRAAGAGIITSTAKLAKSYGWHIRQRLDEGLNAVYAHLSHIGVRAGQRVAAGQGIGRVGNTGNSFGAHLHFGINESDAATVAFLRGAKVTAASRGGGGEAGPSEKEMSLWKKLKVIPSTIMGMAGKIRSGMSGPWGDLMKGGIADLMGDLKTWVLDKINPFKLPGFSGGVRSAPRGAWWAGENGPEIVQGRGGENVIPAPRSLALAQQVVGRTNGGGRSQGDYDQLFERLIEALESRERPMVSVGIDQGDIRREVRAEIRTNKGA